MKSRLFVLLMLSLALVGLVAGTALAAGTTKQVGLVIQFPDGSRHLEVVQVPASATTFDVLQAARINLVSLSTAFGPAVCSINGVGCPATNCFCDPANFWAYYHYDPVAKKWMAAAEGVGSYIPADRAVEGFAWSGFDTSFNPTVQPPTYTFEEVVAGNGPADIPEPATLLLLGTGLAGLAGYVRRKTARRL